MVITIKNYTEPRLSLTVSTDFPTHTLMSNHPHIWEWMIEGMRDAVVGAAAAVATAEGISPKADEQRDTQERNVRMYGLQG